MIVRIIHVVVEIEGVAIPYASGIVVQSVNDVPNLLVCDRPLDVNILDSQGPRPFEVDREEAFLAGVGRCELRATVEDVWPGDRYVLNVGRRLAAGIAAGAASGTGVNWLVPVGKVARDEVAKVVLGSDGR